MTTYDFSSTLALVATKISLLETERTNLTALQDVNAVKLANLYAIRTTLEAVESDADAQSALLTQEFIDEITA